MEETKEAKQKGVLYNILYNSIKQGVAKKNDMVIVHISFALHSDSVVLWPGKLLFYLFSK